MLVMMAPPPDVGTLEVLLKKRQLEMRRYRADDSMAVAEGATLWAKVEFVIVAAAVGKRNTPAVETMFWLKRIEEDVMVAFEVRRSTEIPKLF
jgi:hypothetical protein